MKRSLTAAVAGLTLAGLTLAGCSAGAPAEEDATGPLTVWVMGHS